MKEKIVEVKNVLACLELMENLKGRSSITPGIGLIHGPSGFGKTTTLCWLINQLGAMNAIYVRCYATDTPSSFLARIMEELGSEILYQMRKSVDFIVERMNERQLPLFIDEADHIVSQNKIMETIRDLYDATEQPVVLVGMEEIARRISHRKQLFNRLQRYESPQTNRAIDAYLAIAKKHGIDPSQLANHGRRLDACKARRRQW